MNNYPEILYFIGRYHVLLLHLPIGFLAIAFLMEINRVVKGTDRYVPAVRFILFWSVVFTMLTALSGYLLSFEGGYETQLLDRHFWLGIATTGLTLVLYWFKKQERFPKFHLPLFTILMGLLLWTGDVGGSMTHGADHLTTFRPLLTPIAISNNQTARLTDTTQVFKAVIQPILQEKCVQCHNEKKIKGGLLLTSIDAIKKGGDQGAFLIAGDVAESHFLKRVNLPLTEKEHMPPRGKSQLTAEEIDLLEWWVEQGASFEKTFGESNKPNHIQQIIDQKNNPKQGVFTLAIAQPDERQLKKLQSDGFQIKRIAKGSPLLQVDLSSIENLDQSAVKSLRDFKKQIIHLDAGHTVFNDEMMAEVVALKHLTHLHLEGTAITDKGLKKINRFKYLEYLNLYQTEITDEGLAHLEGLAKLKVLYLWQTKVTTKGIEQLNKKLPQLNIITQSGNDIFKDVRLKAPEIIVKRRRTIFADSIIVKLSDPFKGAQVYYTLDGRLPDSTATLFKDSVVLDTSKNFQAVAVKADWLNSEVAQQQFLKISHLAKKVTWNKAPSPDYPGEGTSSFSDLKRGSNFVKSKPWMGWQGGGVTVVLDYGAPISIQKVHVGFMENTNAWVFAPKGIKVWGSKDGTNYQNLIAESYEMRTEPSGVNRLIKSLGFDPITVRYAKVQVTSFKKNPTWHLSPGDPCWLFLDEIAVE